MDLENGLIDIKNLTCLDISYPKNYFLKITDMHGIGNISPTLIFLQIRDLWNLFREHILWQDV